MGVKYRLERIRAIWTKQYSAFIMRSALFNSLDLALFPRRVIDVCEFGIKGFRLSALLRLGVCYLDAQGLCPIDQIRFVAVSQIAVFVAIDKLKNMSRITLSDINLGPAKDGLDVAFAINGAMHMAHLWYSNLGVNVCLIVQYFLSSRRPILLEKH